MHRPSAFTGRRIQVSGWLPLWLPRRAAVDGSDLLVPRDVVYGTTASLP
jgi:hypothetical protein